MQELTDINNFPLQDDSELFYDLKQLLVSSPISHCPPELANHPDAMTNPRYKR